MDGFGLGTPRLVGYAATALCIGAVLGDRMGFWNVRTGWGQWVVIAAMLVAIGGMALARRKRRAP